MDFDGDHYYKLNRTILSAIGLWPHRYVTLRQIQVALSLFLLVSVTFPQFIKLIVEEYDVDVAVRVLSSALPFLLFTVKYLAFYFITEDIKKLMQHIRNDWNALKDNNELEIIHRYAKVSALLTKTLATLIYMSLVIIMCTQYMPSFLNVVAPLNESRRAELLFWVEYFVDQEKHYHIIQFHLDIGLIFAATTILATESFCLAVSIHAYGMFKIASYRMEHIIDTPNVFMGRRYACYDSIVAAVSGHRRAIEFSEICTSTFTIQYLALILLGVTSSSVNLFLLFQIIMSASAMDDLIRIAIHVGLHFLYMFLTNYAGQMFTDYNAEIYKKTCSLRWYKAPLQIQKQLLFIMQKSAKTYHISVGGLYNSSLEGFTTLASTALSYFTVLCSIRK